MTEQATTPAPKKKHRFLKTLGVLGVVIIGIAVATSGGSGDASTTAASSSSNANDAPGIGEAAQDGDFTFTVSKVEDGPQRIGIAEFGVEPQGKFVLVHMTVANHGSEPGSFFGDNQYLVDTQGRKASADTEASMYLDDAQSLFEEINPGNKLSGIVVFDIPADATPESLELHDSAFSGGVTVAVN